MLGVPGGMGLGSEGVGPPIPAPVASTRTLPGRRDTAGVKHGGKRDACLHAPCWLAACGAYGAAVTEDAIAAWSKSYLACKGPRGGQHMGGNQRRLPLRCEELGAAA